MWNRNIAVLFVHCDFPSQFRGLISYFSARKARIAAIRDGSKGAPLINVLDAPYDPVPPSPGNLDWRLRNLDVLVRRGAVAMEAAKMLRARGFIPDLIYVHPGWGEALFLRDIFPESKIIIYCEHYYRLKDSDADFDPEFLLPPQLHPFIRLQNVPYHLALEICDAAISPTQWQRSGFPMVWQNKIEVIHEGVDTDLVHPDYDASYTLGSSGLKFSTGDEIVTYISRDLEPYRGFHIFMRALPELLRLRPNCHVLVVGRDGASYGPRPPDGQTYLRQYLAENPIDLSRVHFLGAVSYPDFIKVLQISACHIYLTYPFVLSWSFIEALSAGCIVIGSSTAPVEEVIADGVNGLLINFFDANGLANLIAKVLSNPERYNYLRQMARRTAIEQYDYRRICLPAHEQLATRIMNQ